MSAVGDPHVTSVTGEKFDMWRTGWSLFVPIPKDIQPELVPYDGDKCGPAFLQNVQISGSIADGHEVPVRADKAKNEGFRESSSEPLSGTLLQNKILRVIKKNLVKKCLEMLAEIAELKDDYTETYEQLGKRLNLEGREDSAIGAKIIERLKLSASKSEDEQLNFKEYVDRMKGELDIYSVVGGSIAAVSSFLIPGILRKSLEEVQKTVEVPQVQYIDKSVDVPVVMQGQVLISQTVQKTVKVPQVQFLDRVVDVPVVAQRQMPQERIVEETRILVPHMMEKTIEVMKPIPQERVQNNTVKQIVDVPVPQILEETVEVIQLLPQDRMSDRAVEQFIDVPVPRIQEKTGHVEAEKYRDENKVDKTKIKAKGGLENHCTAMRNKFIVKEMRSKFEVGHKEEVRARNRSDKDAQEKANLTNQRQVTAIRSVHKTVEVPKVQYIDKVADIPVDVQRQVSTIQAAQHDTQHIDEAVHVPELMESVAPTIPDTDDLCLDETADEDRLEQECKKRKLPMPAEAVSESRADESDFDRFDDLVLPSPQGKTLFVSIASDDEAEDGAEKEQKMTRSLVQGGDSMLVDEIDADAQGPGREMAQAVRAEWSQK